MRGAWGVVAFIISIGLAAGLAVTFAVRGYQERPIQVRINATDVRFRSSKPKSLADKNVIRHVGPGEAFVASGKETNGPKNGGQNGTWYCLTNIATREVGWVAGAYVEAIDRADESRLDRLDSSDASTALWVNQLIEILSIVSAIVTISGFIISRLGRKFKRRSVGLIGAAATNVVEFRSKRKTEPSPIIVGSSGGVPWFYRPKARKQGGGA